MPFFLTNEDLENATKVVVAQGPLRGRIVTPISLAGDHVKLAETGEWYPQRCIQPLTEKQIHEAAMQEVVKFAEGKKIVNFTAKGRGIQFVLDDNTRIIVSYSSAAAMRVTVIDAMGNKVV